MSPPVSMEDLPVFVVIWGGLQMALAAVAVVTGAWAYVHRASYHYTGVAVLSAVLVCILGSH